MIGTVATAITLAPIVGLSIWAWFRPWQLGTLLLAAVAFTPSVIAIANGEARQFWAQASETPVIVAPFAGGLFLMAFVAGRRVKPVS